ncbi:hypothetical protein BT96DRAFT_175482 [Gymnopus androsaceus JB14]|uniref:Uncharacterized protein n=1 Tax=Gymnopus androsaceus JB14 TaxID=1447944 RepID=A0A6A4IE47_9AGAR|nr:hypothetical protein BT96DRAFT_175482 [Gymnopus androsaceus JB14]
MPSPPPQWAFIPEPASSNVSENEEEMEETRVKEKPKPKRRAADPVSAQPKKKQRMESGSKLVGPARLGPPSKINMTPAPTPAASTSTSHNQRNRNAAMPARKPSAEDRVAAELNNSFSSSTAPRKRTKKEIMKREHAVAGVDKDTAIVVSSSDSEKEPFGGKIPGAGPPSRPSPLASATKGKDDKVARAGPSSRPHLTSSASAPVPKTAPAPLEVIEISDSDDELPPKPKPVARPRPSTSSHPPPNSRPVSNSASAGDYEDLVLDGSGNNMDAAMDEDMDMMLDPPFAPSPSKESSITVPVSKKNEKKLSLSSFFSHPPAPSTATAPRSASTSNSNSASAKPVANGSASASSHPRLKLNPGALSAPPTTMAQPMVISSDSDPDSDSKEASQRPLTATEPVFTRAIVPDTRPTSAAVSSKRSTVVPDSRPSSAAASSKPKESSS